MTVSIGPKPGMFTCPLRSLQELLSDKNVGVRREFKLNSLLQSRWSHRCRIHFHAEQPSIKKLSNIFRPSRCLLLGLCVCGHHPGSCPDAWFFPETCAVGCKASFSKSRRCHPKLANNSNAKLWFWLSVPCRRRICLLMRNLILCSTSFT